MQVAGMLLGCLLLGAGPVAGGHPVRSPEIVAEAMLLPVGSAVAGQPLTLLAALGSTGRSRSAVADRPRVLAAGPGGCRLSLLPGSCQERSNESRRQAGAMRRCGWPKPRRRRSSARPNSPRCALSTNWRNWCGCRPARRCRCPPIVRWWFPIARDSTNCLPAERLPKRRGWPRKSFPLQRQAIDDRAAAVQAADDALVAVTDNLQTGKGDAAAVVACSRELLRQQRAFIEPSAPTTATSPTTP